jgi:RsiW-degrading membrane proteinase PrsW (M82 family)
VRLWLGLLAAPAAWTAQLVFGYGAEEADCAAGSGGWNFSSHTMNAVLFAVAGVVALAGLGAAFWAARHVEHDPRGRVAFMAFGGVLVSSLFAALVILTGIGVLSLEPCTPG